MASKHAVIIKTKLDNASVTQDFKAMTQEVKKLSSEFNENAKDIQVNSEKIKELKGDLYDLVETTSKKKKYDLIISQEDYNKLSSELKNLKSQLKMVQEAFGYVYTTPGLEGANAQMSELARKEEELKAKIGDITRTLATAQIDTGISKEAEKSISALETLKEKTNSIFQQIKTKITGVFSNIKSKITGTSKESTNSFSSITDSITKLGNKITKLALTAVVWNTIRTGLNSLKSSFNSILQSNDQFSSSLNQIKANLMTAFAPIYNYVLPAINSLMNALSKATGTIATFIASLFGISTSDAVSQAEELSSSLDDASDSSEKAQSNLAGFDKINVLDTSSSSSSGSTSSSSTGIDYSGDIETSSTLLKFLEKIKSLVASIDFSNLNSAFGNFVDAVKGFGAGTYQALSDFFNNLLVPLAKWTIEDALPNFLNATAQALDKIDWDTITEALNNLWEALLPFAINVGEGLLWFYENVLLPLAGWVISDVLPAFLNILAGAIKILNDVINDAKPILEWLWNNFLSPIMSFVGGVIVTVLNGIGDALNWIGGNEIAVTILESLVLALGLLATAITIYTVASSAGTIATTLMTAAVGAFSAVLAFLTSPITLVIAAITAVIAIIILCIKHWDEIKETVSKVVSTIKDKVVSAFNTIKSKISSIMSSIKTSISNVWNGIWSTIKNVVNSILGGIESFINGIIKGINKLVNAMNTLSWDIPDWVPALGGKKFGFSLKTLNEVSLPRLASGAVIPPRQEFAAILGDQKSGTNIEAPLDTIKQAVAEVNNGLVSQLVSLLQNNQGQDININFEGNLSQLARILKPYIDKENSRKGSTIIKGVT